MMKAFWKVAFVVCLLSIASFVVSADDLFVDFQGPTEILFGPVYTYSVLVQKESEGTGWSATGGHVRKDWWEGSRYFCEVQWYENNPDDPAKLKVYGREKGSDVEIAERFFVTVQAKKRSLDYRSLQNEGGKCLEVNIEDLVKNEGRIQVWECNGSIQQRWKLDEVGRLVNEGGKCLDAHLPDLKTDGGKVQTWDCVDVVQQQWTLSENGALVNGGGKCLDVNLPEFKTDGGKVQLWECGDVVQQRWKWLE